MELWQTLVSTFVFLVMVKLRGTQSSVYTNHTLSRTQGSWKSGTDPISMAFVFDRTGSMFDDLVQVRAGAARILNNTIRNGQTAPQNYILVPFRDPDVGPPFQTDDPKKFLAALNNIEVLGGKDCPEMSITAIKLALELCLSGSVVYVFTDAEAKDYNILPEVIRLIKEKNVRVNFVLTGNCGLDPHESLGPDTYETIATVSSGQIVNLNKSEVNKIWKFVKISINFNRKSIFSADKLSGGKHIYVVEIHRFVDEIVVTATGEEVKLTVVDGDGRFVYPQDKSVEEVIKFATIVSVLVTNPRPGNWSFTVESKGRHTLRVGGLSNHWNKIEGEHKIVIIQDTDECATNTHDCTTNEICRNTANGYTCECKIGFEKTNEGRCIDVDECSRTRDICGKLECINRPGTYRCEERCVEGLRRVGSTCEDVNECEKRPGICDGYHCVNTYGSYRCQISLCKNGFRYEGEECKDVDECARNLDICGDLECINTPGSYRCKRRCQDGYMRGSNGVCLDIDECKKYSLICGNRECINIAGSYRCRTRCPNGYRAKRAGECTDVNECTQDPQICGEEDCINTHGSYRCEPKCSYGYQRGTTGICIDIDECFQSSRICGDRECINTPGTYRCETKCQRGYKRGENGACRDINECSENPQICGNRKCVNIAGSYRCLTACPSGWERGKHDICVDINECTRNSQICGNHECVNTRGKYHCRTKCSNGYERGRAESCVDVDECAQNSQICGNRECINTPGSYRCRARCPNGFQRAQDDECVDIDECAQNSQICSTRECINTPGSYRCRARCPNGFQRADDECVDIDECAQNSQICGNRECINTPGRYRCRTKCPSGWERGRDGTCVDIDECTQNSKICGDRDCINTRGSYHCQTRCLIGFQIENGVCGDIDECVQNPNICGSLRCINNRGSYRCQNRCPSGYESGKNGVCTDINECLETPRRCQYDCVNIKGSFQCLCPRGFRLNNDHVTCIRINRCPSHGYGKCQHQCNEDTGKCECPKGYHLHWDKISCIDINECLTGQHACGLRECFNTLGKYHCLNVSCPSGYFLGSDGYCTKQCNYNSANRDCPGQYSSIQHNAVSIPCYLPLNTDFMQLQPHIPQAMNFRQQLPCYCSVYFYPFGQNNNIFGLYQVGDVGRLYNRVVLNRPGFYELHLYSDYLNAYGGILGRTTYRVFVDVSDYAF